MIIPLKDIKMTFLVPGVARADFMIDADGSGFYAFETEDMSEQADLSGIDYATIARGVTDILNADDKTTALTNCDLQGAIWNDDCKIAWSDMNDSTVNNIIDLVVKNIEGFDFLMGFKG